VVVNGYADRFTLHPLTLTVMAEIVGLQVASTFVDPGDDSFLFTGPRRGTLRFGTLYKEWGKARKSHGLDYLRLHDLRHTAGTLAATTGASTREIMSRLGHSSPQAALRYQHATAQRDREIADRLGDMMGTAVSGGSVVGQLGHVEGTATNLRRQSSC